MAPSDQRDPKFKVTNSSIYAKDMLFALYAFAIPKMGYVAWKKEFKLIIF